MFSAIVLAAALTVPDQPIVLGYSPADQRTFYGLSGMFDEDLARRRETSTYETENWLFGGEPHQTTSDHTIGQTTWGAMLVMGRQFDLAAY